jgi:hypothetical protein
MALFLGAHVHDLYRAGSLSTAAFATWIIAIVGYVLSIVGGRLYTGMHGFLDCFVGILLGTIAWMLQRLVMQKVEWWITSSGWSGASFMRHIKYILLSACSTPYCDVHLFALGQSTPITR